MSHIMSRAPITYPWTDQEIAMLRVMLASGVSPRSAALKLRRKLGGVKAKIRKIRAGDQETARQRSGVGPGSQTRRQRG
jgi:hypothetical protein